MHSDIIMIEYISETNHEEGYFGVWLSMHVAQNDYSLCRELYCTKTQLAKQRLKLHHERTYCIITTIS
jgi:hypothetical protein